MSNDYVCSVNKTNKLISNFISDKKKQLAKNPKLEKFLIRASYEEDRRFQQMKKLVKSKDAAQIAKLPAPWKEKISSFIFDERLVIPKNMR